MDREHVRRDKAAILEQLARAGADVSRPGSMRCPWHDDRSPSAGIYQRSTGVWAFHCHACEFDYDVFDVRARVEGRRAGEILKEMRGLQSSGGRVSPNTKASPHNHASMAETYAGALDEETREIIAGELSVHPESLERLGVGIDSQGYSTWPERDISGRVIGLLRRPRTQGRKVCVKGSRRGLTLPDGGIITCGSDGPLLVAEGASDVAALLSMGLPAIGRAAAKQGNDLLVELLQGFRGEVIVLADNDASGVGQAGAESAARALVARGVAASWALTPESANDPRSWVRDRVRNGLDLGHDQACLDAGQDFLRAIVRMAPALAQQQPRWRHPLEFQPFPTDILPPVLADIVREGALVHQVDESMIALPAITCAASAVGAKRCIVCGGQRRLPVVWGVMIAQSGANKTEAMHEGIRPILEAEREASREYAGLIAEYERTRREYDAKRTTDRLEAEAPVPPVRRRYRTSDYTVEAVHGLLDQNQCSILIARNELSGFFDFGRYSRSGRGTGEVATILEWFDGRPIAIDRKSPDSPPIILPHACVSIIGTITPGALARLLTDERYDQGLAARFLVSNPPYRRKKCTMREVDPSIRARFEEVIARLLGVNVTMGDGGIEPEPVYLSGEATELYQSFFNDIEDKLEHANEAGEGNTAAMVAKIGAYGPRLALIMQLLEDPCSTIVEPAAMERGTRLAHWFEYEARRVHASLHMNDDDRMIVKVIEAVRRHGAEGRIAPHKLASSCRWVEGVGHARELLDRLVARGAGRFSHEQNPRGGPTSQVFELACHVMHGAGVADGGFS